MNMLARPSLVIILIIATTALRAQIQVPPWPQVTSPEVTADRHIIFRYFAPQSSEVKLFSTDILNMKAMSKMSRSPEGIWEVTLGPVEPGAYRYNFIVDSVPVINPVNTSISESNMNIWSMVYVPGAEYMEMKKVPHGAVSIINYYSSALKKYRRMHIYTPPGYQSGNGEYPVFYLLHGALDCDDSWTSVGRAAFILDNLIAAGRAVPMVVVMPAGHTGPFQLGDTLPDDAPFLADFLRDLKPYVETNYRVYKDRRHRAIAGLSMGGSQTLDIAIPHLDEFSYIGVFSSGIFGITGGGPASSQARPGPQFEQNYKEKLDDDSLKSGLDLFWFATGKDDFLINTTRATVKMLRNHGFKVAYKESPGGHTWLNWREYLREFVPLLFQ